jgi:divalent metal cation (Fe/Co/Zn/Cd) transporter
MFEVLQQIQTYKQYRDEMTLEERQQIKKEIRKQLKENSKVNDSFLQLQLLSLLSNP